MATQIITVWLGDRLDEYRSKLQQIGQNMQERGIDVTDHKRGGISISAVIRQLADNYLKEK